MKIRNGHLFFSQDVFNVIVSVFVQPLFFEGDIKNWTTKGWITSTQAGFITFHYTRLLSSLLLALHNPVFRICLCVVCLVSSQGHRIKGNIWWFCDLLQKQEEKEHLPDAKMVKNIWENTHTFNCGLLFRFSRERDSSVSAHHWYQSKTVTTETKTNRVPHILKINNCQWFLLKMSQSFFNKEQLSE